VNTNAGESKTASFSVTTPTIPSPSCIIATAAFGSAAAPAVQFLRNFRDGLVVHTRAGSAFMTVFNAWYYSFSPTVAGFIASHDPLRAPMRVILYPLLGILGLSTFTYSIFSGTPEFAILIAGLLASSLIGLVYLTFPALIGMRALLKRRAVARARIAKVSIATLAISLLLLGVGEVAGSFVLLAIGSSAVVLTCIIAVPVHAALAIMRKNPK
jgi:heme exporter protein D